jgi:hypothetical protein
MMEARENVGTSGPLFGEQKQLLAEETARELGLDPEGVSFVSGERDFYRPGSIHSGIQKIRVRIMDNSTGQEHDHEFALDFGLGGDVEGFSGSGGFSLLGKVLKISVLLAGVYLLAKLSAQVLLIVLGVYLAGFFISYITAPKDVPAKRFLAWPAIWLMSLVFSRRFPWQKS